MDCDFGFAVTMWLIFSARQRSIICLARYIMLSPVRLSACQMGGSVKNGWR